MPSPDQGGNHGELEYAEEDEEDADDHPDVEQRDVGDLGQSIGRS